MAFQMLRNTKTSYYNITISVPVMKTCSIILLVTLLFFNVEVESKRRKVIYDVKSARRLFKEYSNKFKWSFQDDSEEEHRYEIFLENIQLINKHNSDPNVNVYYQIGPYHHLSPKEFLFIYEKPMPLQ